MPRRKMFETIYNLFVKYPYPDVDRTDKTIIVTGANIGLGKEAVRHFVRLNTSKVIIAVRSIAKGNAAQAEIEATTHRTGVMEMWELDLSSYGSMKVFQPALQSCRVASCECCRRQCKYCDDEIRSRRGE